MNVAAYYRVSTSDQNIDLQRDAITTLCTRHPDWTVVEYVDHGISGAKDQRPALNRLMAECRRGRIGRVVVYKFDRFARSTTHLLRALEEFRALEVDFVSVSESVDTSTPMGKMIFTVVSALAEFERDLIRSRVVAGQQSAKARGKHIGRPKSITSEKVSQIAFMRENGASERTIASVLRLSPASVHRALASFTPNVQVTA